MTRWTRLSRGDGRERRLYMWKATAYIVHIASERIAAIKTRAKEAHVSQSPTCH
jgi:hypothetical protein